MPRQIIEFDVKDRHARAGFARLKREISELDTGFRDTRREARAAAAAFATLGDATHHTTAHIDRLGIAAKQQNALWRETNDRLREARERYVSAAQGAARFANAVDAVRGLRAGFGAARAASHAYDTAQIANAQNARAAETEAIEAYTALQTRSFELGRQRTFAERQLTAENQRFLAQLSRERIAAAHAASTAEVEGFHAAAQAAKDYAEQRERLIHAIPRSSPDAHSGNFTAHMRKDFEATERQGRTLLAVLRQLAKDAFRTAVAARLPDPIPRAFALDARSAAAAQGQHTLETMRQAAAEQGRHARQSVLEGEDRDTQRSLQTRARAYRHFATLVSRTFRTVATGQQQGFEQVATQFIRQSSRIVGRALIEHHIRLRLADTLTAHKIANLKKVSLAQQAAFAGIGGPGVPNLPGLGNIGAAFSGGGAALGVAALLFPQAIKNLAGGIKETLGGFLADVSVDTQFGAPQVPQQILLKIGDTEIRDITDIQTALREEDRL